MVVGGLSDEIDAERLVVAAERARRHDGELVAQLGEHRVRRLFGRVGARLGGAVAIEGDRDRVGVRRRRGESPLQRSQLHFHEDEPTEEAEAAAERGGVAAAGVHQREQLEHELVEPLQ